MAMMRKRHMWAVVWHNNRGGLEYAFDVVPNSGGMRAPLMSPSRAAAELACDRRNVIDVDKHYTVIGVRLEAI